MFTLTIDNSDKMMQRYYNTYHEALAVATRAIEIYRSKQARFDKNIQVLNYLAIDSDSEMDVFYFDGSVLVK